MATKEEKDIQIIEELDKNLMDHKYDGIMELDNSLPPWWLYLFYGTIIFGLIYMVKQFGYDSFNQEKEYVEEVTKAEEAIAVFKENFGGEEVNENTVVLAEDESALNDGKAIYTANCVACHLENGGGLVGPNLTDDYWIHGASVQEVFTTIKYGVPEKGMIPWETQLNPTQIQNVTSYLLTRLAGTNVEGGKAPEGDKVEFTEKEPDAGSAPDSLVENEVDAQEPAE